MTQARRQIDWEPIRDALDRRMKGTRLSFADDAERTAAILRERSSLLARAPDRRARGATPFMLFSCGGARFGLPLTALQEVAPLTRVAQVPGAVPSVLGVTSWRGAFVTVFDVLALLGVARADGTATAYAAIFRAAGIALGFDHAAGVGKFEMSTLRSAEGWHSASPELFHGATADAVALFDAARLAERLRRDLRAT